MTTTMMNIGNMVTTERSRYELVRFLGRGGMGEVWEALDLRRGGYVAVKFMLDGSTELRRRFRREARVLHGLSHPSIVRFIDDGETEHGKLFLVLERLYGQTLREKLGLAEKLPIREALKIAHAIAGALVVAHDCGVVHRDLKPANVFIQDEQMTRRRASDIKLIDFGIAKDAISLAETQCTAPNALLGSFRYMSPEQVNGQTVDHRTDVWSLGVVLFEMIQGDHLFQASSGMIMDAVRYFPLDPLPWRGIRVPDKIDAIIRRCLQRDVVQRIESAEELEIELGRLLLTPDDELEVVCIPTNISGETTAVIGPIGGPLAVNTEDALARSVIEGMKEITRHANENHREVMRSMRVFGLAGLALLLALVLLLSSQNLHLPWSHRILANEPLAPTGPAPVNLGNRPARMPDYPR